MNIICGIVMTFMVLALRIFRIKRWSPVYIFCVFWWAQFIICYILFPNTEWSILSAIYISMCGIAAMIGHVFAYSKQEDKRNIELNFNKYSKKEYRYNYENARIMIIIYILIGFAYALISLRQYGFSLSSFTSIDSMLTMNNDIAISRYGNSNDVSSGTLLQIMLSFVYFAPMAGGYHLGFSKMRRDKLLCIATFFPELVVLFSANMKAGFIGCVIFFVSGYFVAIFKIRQSIRFSIKSMVGVIIVFIGLVTMLMMTMILRTGSINQNTFNIVLRKFGNYAFGHVAAIDDWLNSNMIHTDWQFGIQTFIGIAKYLGLATRVQGVYQENYIGPDLATNVFSYFRGIHMDYGMLGSLLFFVFFGFLSSCALKKVCINQNKSCIAEMILALCYSFILYFFVSIFSYLSFVLVFFLFVIHLYISQAKKVIRFKWKIRLLLKK